MKKPIIKKVFKRIANPNVDYDLALSNALLNTYLMKLPQKAHGKTLCNLHIIINMPFDKSEFDEIEEENEEDKEIEERENIVKRSKISEEREIENSISNEHRSKKIIAEEKRILFKGYLLICFIHEFSHYYQRADLNTVGQILEFKTPRSSNALEAEESIQKIAISESGFQSEILLFTKISRFLSVEAAKFLTQDPYPNTIKKFRKAFEKANVKNFIQCTLDLSKDDVTDPLCLEIGICGIAEERFGENAYLFRS